MNANAHIHALQSLFLARSWHRNPLLFNPSTLPTSFFFSQHWSWWPLSHQPSTAAYILCSSHKLCLLESYIYIRSPSALVFDDWEDPWLSWVSGFTATLQQLLPLLLSLFARYSALRPVSTRLIVERINDRFPFAVNIIIPSETQQPSLGGHYPKPRHLRLYCRSQHRKQWNRNWLDDGFCK